MSQVGVTLFPSFQHYLSFHFSRFSFYINIYSILIDKDLHVSQTLSISHIFFIDQ